MFKTRKVALIKINIFLNSHLLYTFTNDVISIFHRLGWSDFYLNLKGSIHEKDVMSLLMYKSRKTRLVFFVHLKYPGEKKGFYKSWLMN